MNRFANFRNKLIGMRINRLNASQACCLRARVDHHHPNMSSSKHCRFQCIKICVTLEEQTIGITSETKLRGGRSENFGKSKSCLLEMTAISPVFDDTDDATGHTN